MENNKFEDIRDYETCRAHGNIDCQTLECRVTRIEEYLMQQEENDRMNFKMKVKAALRRGE